jgi:hypothetical protein
MPDAPDPGDDLIFSLTSSLSDDPVELTLQQESLLVRLAEAFTTFPIPPGSVGPEVQSVFPRFAAFMQRAWQDREMPPAIAAFISRFGS